METHPLLLAFRRFGRPSLSHFPLPSQQKIQTSRQIRHDIAASRIGEGHRDDGEGFIGHPQERFRGIDLKGIYSNFFVEGEFNSNQVEPCGNCCHFCLLFAVRLLPQITQVGINYQ